jgi:hypothetical protein
MAAAYGVSMPSGTRACAADIGQWRAICFDQKSQMTFAIQNMKQQYSNE